MITEIAIYFPTYVVCETIVMTVCVCVCVCINLSFIKINIISEYQWVV